LTGFIFHPGLGTGRHHESVVKKSPAIEVGDFFDFIALLDGRQGR
jgi:hypothetical protein